MAKSGKITVIKYGGLGGRKTRTTVTCSECNKPYQKTVNRLSGFRFDDRLSKKKINGNFFNSNETHICKKCKKARY